MAREPGYCLHKPTQQAYVRLNGKLYYLGAYGTEESKQKYRQLKAEYLANSQSQKYAARATGPTVADVCLAFLDHATEYYKQGTEVDHYQQAMKPLSEVYAELPANKFGVLEFRVVRDWWLKTPIERSTKADRPANKPTKPKPPKYRSRGYVNKLMKRTIRIFKWAASVDMVPASVHLNLSCVDPLKRGRTEAPETDPIKPVDEKLVEATKEHLTKVLSDMVSFQLLTGCRPGEVCKLTPAMVDRSSEVWEIVLTEHKTAYRGKQRTIYAGPKAQALLTPYLLRDADAPCFSPIESERQRREAVHAARVTPLSCGNKPGSKKLSRKPRREPGMAYTAASFAKAIGYACVRGKLEHWHPNQLRHTAATKIRKEFGLDVASVMLGHTNVGVTQVYAEQDRAKAIDVARKAG